MKTTMTIVDDKDNTKIDISVENFNQIVNLLRIDVMNNNNFNKIPAIKLLRQVVPQVFDRQWHYERSSLSLLNAKRMIENAYNWNQVANPTVQEQDLITQFKKTILTAPRNISDERIKELFGEAYHQYTIEKN